MTAAPVEVPLETLGREIKASIEKGDKAAGKAEEHYMSAGLRMVEAKRRVEAERGSFRGFLEQHGIGRSRAYDILAVAEGKKTFAGIRAKGAARAAKHAEQNRIAREVSVSNGHSDPEALPAPVGLELETLRAENARLVIERDEALAEVERLKAEVGRLKAVKADPAKALRSTTAVIRRPEPPAQPLKTTVTISEFDPSKIGFVAKIARYNDPSTKLPI